MAEAGKKKKKATAVPLGEFLAADTKKDWADVPDEEEGDSRGGEDRYGDDRRGDYSRGDDDRGYERRGYNRSGGDRYGSGDRYGDRGDRGDRYGDRDREGGGRYGGNRYGDRGGDREGGGRYGGDRGDRGDRYDDRGGRRNDRRRNDGPPKEAPNHPPYIAFVGNLDFSADEASVSDFFSEHCKVTNTRLLIDRQTGRSKGYGYVTFEDRESLVTALEANGVDFHGRPLRVDVAEERADSGPRDRPQREVAPSRADQVDKWERGKAIPREEREKRQPYNRDRREGGDRGDRGNDRNAPRERKPLNLQPRSDNAGKSDASNRSSKPDPFGGAKPRDELYYQKKKDEERAQRGDSPTTSKKDDKGPKSRGGKPRQAKEESKPVETTNLYAVLEKEESN